MAKRSDGVQSSNATEILLHRAALIEADIISQLKFAQLWGDDVLKNVYKALLPLYKQRDAILDIVIKLEEAE